MTALRTWTSFHARAAQQSENPHARVEITATGFKRLQNGRLQTIPRGRRWMTRPGARVGLLDHENATGPHEPEHFGQKLVVAPDGSEQETHVDQVEARVWQAGRIRIGRLNLDVREPRLFSIGAGRGELLRIAVHADHLPPRVRRAD